jgi:putative Ca2+/H+ antiporter (TMEM165/GDT1 family)
VLAGGWLQKKVPLNKIQRAAAVLFVLIGIVTIVSAAV